MRTWHVWGLHDDGQPEQLADLQANLIMWLYFWGSTGVQVEFEDAEPDDARAMWRWRFRTV